MRRAIVVLWLLLGSAAPASAQVSVGIGLPHINIGINLPVYPRLERVPDYPVYYAPGLDTNYFFYDGLYWVYQGDEWYASSWYNGPWGRVANDGVPLFILRVPVRYYRRPPVYFRGWRADAPPRWGDHWGHDWHQRRPGWDHWDRRSAPSPAPLPVYQRDYRGERYPKAIERQQALQSEHYRYQPREDVVRRHVQQQREPERHRDAAPAPRQAQRNERDNDRGRGNDSRRDNDRDNDRGNDRDRGRDRGDERGRGREK